jgi:hypothetical protein
VATPALFSSLLIRRIKRLKVVERQNAVQAQIGATGVNIKSKKANHGTTAGFVQK